MSNIEDAINVFEEYINLDKKNEMNKRIQKKFSLMCDFSLLKNNISLIENVDVEYEEYWKKNHDNGVEIFSNLISLKNYLNDDIAWEKWSLTVEEENNWEWSKASHKKSIQKKAEQDEQDEQNEQNKKNESHLDLGEIRSRWDAQQSFSILPSKFLLKTYERIQVLQKYHDDLINNAELYQDEFSDDQDTFFLEVKKYTKNLRLYLEEKRKQIVKTIKSRVLYANEISYPQSDNPFGYILKRLMDLNIKDNELNKNYDEYILNEKEYRHYLRLSNDKNVIKEFDNSLDVNIYKNNVNGDKKLKIFVLPKVVSMETPRYRSRWFAWSSTWFSPKLFKYKFSKNQQLLLVRINALAENSRKFKVNHGKPGSYEIDSYFSTLSELLSDIKATQEKTDVILNSLNSINTFNFIKLILYWKQRRYLLKWKEFYRAQKEFLQEKQFIKNINSFDIIYMNDTKVELTPSVTALPKNNIEKFDNLKSIDSLDLYIILKEIPRSRPYLFKLFPNRHFKFEFAQKQLFLLEKINELNSFKELTAKKEIILNSKYNFFTVFEKNYSLVEQLLKTKIKEIKNDESDFSGILSKQRYNYILKWKLFYQSQLTTLANINKDIFNKSINFVENFIDPTVSTVENYPEFEKMKAFIGGFQEFLEKNKHNKKHKSFLLKFISNDSLEKINIKLSTLLNKCNQKIDFCLLDKSISDGSPLDFEKLYYFQREGYFIYRRRGGEISKINEEIEKNKENHESEINVIRNKKIMDRLRLESKKLLYDFMNSDTDEKRKIIKNKLVVLIKIFKDRAHCLKQDNNFDKNYKFYEAFNQKLSISYCRVLNEKNKNSIKCQQANELIVAAGLDEESVISREYGLNKVFLIKNISKLFSKLEESIGSCVLNTLDVFGNDFRQDKSANDYLTIFNELKKDYFCYPVILIKQNNLSKNSVYSELVSKNPVEIADLIDIVRSLDKEKDYFLNYVKVLSNKTENIKNLENILKNLTILLDKVLNKTSNVNKGEINSRDYDSLATFFSRKFFLANPAIFEVNEQNNEKYVKN